MDRLGDLKHCFPRKLEENWGFAHKQFFQLRKNVFFARATSNVVWLWKGRLQENKKTTYWQILLDGLQLRKNNFSGSIFFSHCSYDTQRRPAFQKKTVQALFFFRAILWNSKKPGFAEKTTFQVLKNMFFHAALMKLREAHLCKKTIFQTLKNCLLHTNLMKFRQAWLCKKNNFSGSKKMFFSTLILWNSNKSGFAKKNQALKKCVLSWNSDEPGFAN